MIRFPTSSDQTIPRVLKRWMEPLANRWQPCGDGGRSGAADRMSPAAGADANGKAHRVCDVIDNVVRTSRITADASGNVVETQIMADSPGDVVVRAGRISAHANRANELTLGVVESQTAAEYIYAADFTADHGVVGLAVVRGSASISYAGIHGVAGLQAEQRATWLDSAVKIGGGEC